MNAIARYNNLMDYLNHVSIERGFSSFNDAAQNGMTYVVESIIEDAGDIFKNNIYK